MKIAELYKLYKQYYLVDTDTRKIRKNTIFFALKGTNFNGNTFAEKAIANGAKYAVVDEAKYVTSDKMILVNDSLQTLQQLAIYHRKQLKIPFIGITGSNGKTTSKELIACVLHKKYTVLATNGNLNNHIGVPLTVLSVEPNTEIAVIEMGANHQKEIAFLCSIAAPDFGYITNFGKAHLEGFGGISGVIKGKSELYDYLRVHEQKAFINPNDKLQVEKSAGIATISFSKNIEFVAAKPFVCISYNNTPLTTNLIGDYNYSNIAIAVSIGQYFGVNDELIQEAIQTYTPQNNRSQIIKTTSNEILLDAYNANPSSMEVALQNFSQLQNGPKTVILGDMLELGIATKQAHQKIADMTSNLGFEKVYLVGTFFRAVQTKQQVFESFAQLKKHLKQFPLTNQNIFIKGSRGMQLERCLDYID